jgi:glycosyltransferase involved in cell wall biosynthesis
MREDLVTALLADPISRGGLDPANGDVELSVVMPCLNESLTVGRCVEKAIRAIEAMGIRGEVIVADNGSTDRSPEIATSHGARVVHVERRGYGSALQAGIAAARGRFVIMGDADDSYDFSRLELFVERLRDGHDLVMGNRFRGGILPGAMPWHHRYIGNPVLTGILNLFFRTPIGDAHCGLRGFRKDAYGRLGLTTPGMEFASEMVVRACLSRQKVTEVPTVLHPDGRDRPPHLRSFRDGWRHLRFMLMCTPTFLFLIPGLFLTLLGLFAIPGAALAGYGVFTNAFGPNFMFSASLASISGFHLLAFGLLAKFYAHRVDPVFRDPRLEQVARLFSVERGLVIGVTLIVVAIALGLPVLIHWARTQEVFSPAQWIFAGTLFSLGLEATFAAFLIGILNLPREEGQAEG